MRRIVSILSILALITPLLSLFSLPVYATQNTYHGISASNELDEFKRIPEGYPIYSVSDDGLDMRARFAYVKFDDLPVQLYMAVDTEKTADNGYILIHERDVASWIAYYGQYSTDQFIRSADRPHGPISIGTSTRYHVCTIIGKIER